MVEKQVAQKQRMSHRIVILCAPEEAAEVSDAAFWFEVLGPDLERDPAELFPSLTEPSEDSEGEKR